jgi:hypothetical protein
MSQQDQTNLKGLCSFSAPFHLFRTKNANGKFLKRKSFLTRKAALSPSHTKFCLHDVCSGRFPDEKITALGLDDSEQL